MNNKFDLNSHFTWLIAPSFLVFIGFNWMLKNLGNSTLSLGNVTLADHPEVIELAGRYQMLAAGVFDLAAGIAVLLIFALNMETAFSRRVWRLAGPVVALGAAIGIFTSIISTTDSIDFVFLLDDTFFATALSVGRATVCEAAAIDCGASHGLWVLEAVTDPINIVTSIAAPVVLFGMILALGRRGPESPTAEELKISHEILQRYLYLSGLLLSAGMMFLMAWMNWPTGLIADETLANAYSGLVGAIALFMGTGFTLMILVTYLPVMLVLRQRAAGVGPDALAKADIPVATYTEGLKTIVAILSPILASAVGGFGQGVLFQ